MLVGCLVQRLPGHPGESYRYSIMDTLGVAFAATWRAALQNTQNVVIDLMFGSVIGIVAYPFLGPRVWSCYGCALARLMELTGGFSRWRLKVIPSDRYNGWAVARWSRLASMPLSGLTVSSRI